MLLASYMLYQMIWLPTSQSTSMCYTSMLMRMSPWDLGLLGWMWNTLMTGDSVVAPHLTVSGRLRQAISVLPRLIGLVVGFASQLRE
uniref:Uncharacterized protein MANES_03G130500 n=2 Tax=Rhizophora mucronata TaxID=61149 RepID=A0A2P2KN38_RHIMU